MKEATMILRSKPLVAKETKRPVKKSFIDKMRLRQNWDLYVMLLPVIAFVVIFSYIPMYGVQLAFREFVPTRGIWNSPWVGFSHFTRFFNSFFFQRVVRNTLSINIYQLIVGFPAPIILALLINEVRSKHFRKTVQLVTYAPHFLSVVVVVGMLNRLLSFNNGIVNHMIVRMGGERFNFIASPEWFQTLFVFSGVWQSTGWSAIIYIAAISSIDTQLYEAATVDGANKLQRLFYITIPSIIPTAIILLILESGRIMNVGFERIFLMQNPLNMETADVIATFVYRSGLLGAQFGFATAVGLFNSVINFVLIIVVNYIARRVGDTSLW